MAVARNGGHWLSWQANGAGEPLLLIMGLGGPASAWARLLPHVEAGHRAIVMDNRGTGNSDPLRRRIGMRDLVSDVLAVLDASGEQSAHVMGVSMGGMIAQHLALDHRDRVRSLILACTTARGRSDNRPPWRLMGSTALRPLLGPERTWEMVKPALYARRTLQEHPELVVQDAYLRGGKPTPTATYLAQLAAIAGHDTRSRLHELDGTGVTIIHGEEDRLVPPARAEELASAIPGARLVMIPSCGHMITTDAEQASADAVLAHLARHASPQPSSPVA